MTRKRAIEVLKAWDLNWSDEFTTNEFEQAFAIAIKALEQKHILNKIRDKIIEEKECAYADFEQYKVEYLGQDWEGVEDSLPQDDFRYGMERCIEIIDKYKTESENKKCI